jgi:AhpD family alkylhydroperoxidase
MKTGAKRQPYQPTRAVRRMMTRFGLEAPGPREILEQLRKAAAGEGAVDRRTTQLVAVAICVAAGRDDCIAQHVYDAVEAGTSRPEILEIVGTAMLVGGRRSLSCGSEAVAALDHLTKGRELDPARARGVSDYRRQKTREV